MLATPSRMAILAASTTGAGRESYSVSAINWAKVWVAPISLPVLFY